MHGFLNPSNTYTVRQLLDRLKAVYCGSIGYEYMHITNRAQCNWIRDRIETAADTPLTVEEKRQLLDRLCYAEVCVYVCVMHGRVCVCRRGATGLQRWALALACMTWEPRRLPD